MVDEAEDIRQEEEVVDEAAIDPNDPGGYLNLCPELANVMHIPAVAHAVRNGNGRQLYQALDEHRDAHAAVPTILSERRLFIEPVDSAPTLYTVNGIGTTLYTSDRRDDGTAIGTLWLTLVFLPVFPLRQYLVADAGADGWHFFGRVPFGGLAKAWRRAVAGLLFATVGTAAYAVWQGSQRADVHFLSGLDFPVAVTAGTTTLTLAPGSHVIERVGTGLQTVIVATLEGRELSREDVDVPSFTDVVAYNVLGSAPLYAEGIIYSDRDAAQDNPLDLYIGKTFVTNDDVSYPFEEPPESIMIDESQSQATRWVVDVLDGGWEASLGVLDEMGRVDEARALAVRLSDASPESSAVHLAGFGYVAEHGTAEERDAFVTRLVERFPDSERIRSLAALGDESAEEPPAPAPPAEKKKRKRKRKRKR